LAALGPGSALRGGARLFEGLSHLLEGDDDTADAVLTHAVDVSTDLGGFAAATVASAARALIAMSRLEWDDAAALVAGAVSLVDEQHLDAYLEASLAFVAAARLAVHDGDQATARDFVARAARLRPLLTYAVPCTAWFQLQLARTYLELADPDGARTVLRETREILRQRPDLGIVPGAVERLHAEVDAARHRSIGASSLTTAELRLLPYLPTHLSFPEIAERLYLSRHTVTTQAIAIYRKLGATSRSEAIRRAHDIGLLAT
ncbi:MAG TPA: LuxR C-terminal-related transcriptional regulator, partial [Ilumatobacteraceae bacterium]|nr:LuxR C-terminal-related transcriptional regulator [Ilumatobacteraceae bacterium]